MRSGLLCPVSIRSVLCTTFLPFLLSAVAVYGCCPALLFALAFLKGFSTGFVGLAIQQAFLPGGWLVRWLLCFSGLHSLPVLYGLWLRSLSRREQISFSTVLWLMCLAGILGSISYFMIAPLAAHVIHF